MLDELRQYYEANKISAMKFDCKHYEECKEGWNKFTKAKEAFVSTGYEKHELPRLLFLSLDSGEGNQNAKYQTLQYIREKEETTFNLTSLYQDKPKHWYQTHELAQWLLKEYRFSLHISQVHHYFAHTTSIKCSTNLLHREKADKKLYRNCKEFIPGELAILDPDILVTQGDEAKIAVTGKFEESPLANYVVTDAYFPEVKIIAINDSPVFWVHTYHPSAYGDFNQQKTERFHFYTKMAFEFILKTKRWNGKIT